MDIKISGNGPAIVVALHGIQGTRAVWDRVATRLASEATFVLPNLRGRGQAVRGHGVDDYRLARFADDLEEVIGSCVVGRDYWLAGWSMGVSVALEYLAREGGRRPRGVVLCSGTAALRSTAWFRATERSALVDEITARERRLNLKEAADHDAVAWTWAAIRETDQTAVLPSIEIPALIVSGTADDQCPPQCAQTLASGLRGSSLKMLGGGHSLPVTHADALAALFREILPSQI
ncbi:alpha/beta fold hydrolase [Paraburkholderia xenovorans]